ncbi:RNA-binding protein 5 isoform X2 [Macadamia integrifolia]|uniref:RNA-binding protein 5 isoform X2 n=1 Tax=Macadamia integrifolia TaxID=60698 RepID=UPI001C4E5611|nr:RNA-binding protein 5 isoform X2 [Macadamia integrifolia]
MAGTQEQESQELQRDDYSFVWDDESKLYYHASTGFYHDPDAGCYYNSRDGLYYKFEDGHYVPLEYDKGEESKADQCREMVPDEYIQGQMEYVNSSGPENPPPTSEWLEETLIDLYLTGYPNSRINTADDSAVPLESDGSGNNDTYEIEEGEWIPEDLQGATMSNERVSDEVASRDEENWRAQYGQVLKSREEDVLPFHAVDLWDWAMVKETIRKKKHQAARLVGRLVKPSMKLHPSLPSSGGILKTSTICEVHFDLYKIPEYRDRAAERRALHGGFGVGPGQKNSGVDDYDTESSHPVCSEEEGAAEALNNSFGAGSYARRIIESMGWKEGEGLGNTGKGLTEPLKAIGNKGCAGLGWDANRSNKF